MTPVSLVTSIIGIPVIIQVVVVAAAVVVTTTTPVRSMTVVILTVAPVTTLLRGASSCPEEPSKSKEALHELRASLSTCLPNGMILPLQALLLR
uniref:Uncharacterized protein n=2 Tax=Tanacetum cinerariifolium TaxID=118510 RepID=A0A699UYK3_TANCI|nr:hypothetical protein [Tanacetum cinerariifolium]